MMERTDCAARGFLSRTVSVCLHEKQHFGVMQHKLRVTALIHPDFPKLGADVCGALGRVIGLAAGLTSCWKLGADSTRSVSL